MKNMLTGIKNQLLNFKNLRRWPRMLFALINLSAVIALLALVREEYILTDTSSASNNDRGGIVFGISLVAEKPQTLLSDLNAGEKANNLSASFLLQSQSPSTEVFLDYVSIYGNTNEPQYCFTSFRLGRDINVPFQVISEIENTLTAVGTDNNKNLGKFEGNTQTNEYVFKLKDALCLEKGSKYFLPHIFLGITASETYAKFGLDTIMGHRALEFFPFDEQKIVFDITTYFGKDGKIFSIRPNLEVAIPQQGWVGSFEDTNDKTILHLRRPFFYRIILIVFSSIMVVFILLLNNIIDTEDGFFEVSFGLLLGLWGTHEILIPNYIESSVPIDIIIYVLYLLVISEIVVVFVDEYFIRSRGRKIKIAKIIKGNLENERVVIENPSLFPIDMTGWLLTDRAMNKFKFPLFVLAGKNPLTGYKKTVTIWTKVSPKSAPKSTGDLFWAKRREVWNNNDDTAYLEDSRGEIIDIYPYAEETK